MEESYYRVLGLSNASSTEEIRRAYRKLAMQWHPDKWANNPTMLGEAKRKFQKIQEAYSVLSDPRKRTLYDAGVYDPVEEMDEGFCDFMQEMLSLMSQVREEQWHPDKWANNPTMLGEAKRKFQKIQEAYSVLSDPRKRTLYDAGVYDPVEEMDEEKCSSMEDLQNMFAEMVQGFQSPRWYSSPSVASNQGCSGILQQEAQSLRQDSTRPSSSFGVLGMNSSCR